MQVYVKGKKSGTNLSLKSGWRVTADKYDLNGHETVLLNTCAVGTVVKFYEKMVQGNPYATSYGQVAKKKDGTIYIK